MTKQFILLLTTVFTLSLQADCNLYKLLGTEQQSIHKIDSNNTIIWDKTELGWSVSKPQNELDISKMNCKESGYLLINNDKYSYKTPVYSSKFYELKKGWNYLYSYEDGINVTETFSEDEVVEFVYVYDRLSSAWAGYSPNKKIQKSMQNTRILLLKTIEPGIGFYVYATKDSRVKITSNSINSTCQKLVEDKKFAYIVASGLESTAVYNKQKSLGLKSRYVAHYIRGIYNDTRVLLIYPKFTTVSKTTNRYGPAEPKSFIEFAKEYEDKKFYMYDYKFQKCYEGVFSSRKTPPSATLKELK